jgi:hypothetical protein
VCALLTNNERVLSFGLQRIDNAFPGFKSGDFAVFYGYQYCKTLTFRLVVRCQLPIEGNGLNSTAIFVDGGNTFNPYSISAIAQEFGLDPKPALERVFVSRAFTAYQLSAIILETLEEALKQYRSKLVLLSDLTGLFLDKDVPTREAFELFSKAVTYLSDLTIRRNVIVVATCFPFEHSRRHVFLESILLGKASKVIRITESKGKLQFALENSRGVESFTIDIESNAVTLEKFVGA